MEAKKAITTGSDTVLPIPFFKDLIIILGFSAIVINFLMCVVYLIVVLAGKSFAITKWLVIVNFIFLLVEFYFFFL